MLPLIQLVKVSTTTAMVTPWGMMNPMREALLFGRAADHPPSIHR
jgi:hypothetical protein